MTGIFAGLAACHQGHAPNPIAAAQEGFTRSNQFINDRNDKIWDELNWKMKDMGTRPWTETCFPVAARIRSLADSLSERLRSKDISLKQSPTFTLDQQRQLFFELINFRRKAFAAFDSVKYPYVRIEIKELFRYLPLLKGQRDSLTDSTLDLAAQHWADSNFVQGDASVNSLALKKVENDIRISENVLLEFCIKQTMVIDDGHIDRFSPLIAVNATHVRAGQSIEVSAGIGYFSLNTDPKFVIGGRPVTADRNGVAVYTIKAPLSAGKHFIPVRISYFLPDGTSSTVEKRVEYTVDP